MKTLNSYFYKIGLDVGSTTAKIIVLDKNNKTVYSEYQRHNAKIYDTIIPNLYKIKELLKKEKFSIKITGSAGMGISEKTKIPFIQEVIAETEYIKQKYPEVKVLIDMGGEDSKMIFFEPGKAPDIRMNGSCAGGTGAFIDQMISLMNLKPDELDLLASESERIYPVASRCGVFAKTDVQNLLSRNIPKSDIALSIFNAVSVQVINTLARGLTINPKIMFVGGPFTFFNELKKIFIKNLNFTEEDILQTSETQYIPALGSALSQIEDSLSIQEEYLSIDEIIEKFETAQHTKTIAKGRLNPLFDSIREFEEWNKHRFSNLVVEKTFDEYEGKYIFIGIDSGSTTTKILVIGENKEILFRYYEGNKGNSIGAVSKGLTLLKEKLKNHNIVLGGTAVTGYGEDLIKAVYDADYGIVETIAHFTAAKYLNPEVSFIMDIGGQDMKAVFIENGIIKKLELNESCSSGCGSFIETFAENLGYDVKNFATMACKSEAPADLGTRCTVFMNSKVKQSLRENASIDDISAGLAISVIKNALYKVLKLTNPEVLGNNIVVQGGAFRNPSVHRAMEVLTGKKATCSTIPEMMGALGAAIFAQNEYSISSKISTFTGLSNTAQENKFKTRQLICRGCPNVCSITKFTFENGNIFYSGNKCEKIFSNKGSNVAKGFNFISYKEDLIFNRSMQSQTPIMQIGIPRVLNLYENYPFWHTLFTESNIEPVLSDYSTMSIYAKGLGTVMSDTVCFPAKLVHGHIINLAERGIKRIFYPKVFYEKNEFKKAENSYNCPVVAGYPDVIENSIDLQDKYSIIFDSPTVNFNNTKLLKKACKEYFVDQLKISKFTFEKAFKRALKEQENFKKTIKNKGLEIIEKANQENRLLFVVAGRPYHVDPLINQRTPEIITGYGVDIITEDAIPLLDKKFFKDLQVIPQWTYPNRLYNAAYWVTTQKDNVQYVQMNSFGCGPDAITVDEIDGILNTVHKNNTVIRIDEITSTGSINLRIRSLIESLRLIKNRNIKIRRRITTKVFDKQDKHKLILAPYFAPAYSPLLPPLFKILGYNLKVLPPPDKESVEIGLKYSNNEICYPAIIVIGDIIKALQSGKYNQDEIAIGITQTGGQCRASTYLSLIKKGMVSAGFKNIPVVSVGTAGKTLNPQPGFKPNYLKNLPLIFDAMLFADSISKLYYSMIVRVENRSKIDHLFKQYMNQMGEIIENKQSKQIFPLLQQAVDDFNALPASNGIHPKIGFVGEIYVKYNPFANNHIVDWLIDQGVEVVMPPIFEFFAQEFLNIEINKKLNLRKTYFTDIFISLMDDFSKNKVKKYNRILETYKYYEPYQCLRRLSRKAEKIISLANQFGEGWLIPAEVSEFAESGINNTISVQPFGCIANHVISKGIEKRVKEIYPHMNFLFLDFDADTSEVNILNRLYFMLKNAKEEAEILKK